MLHSSVQFIDILVSIFGFREFGRRRADTYKSGHYIDTIHMDILSTEF